MSRPSIGMLEVAKALGVTWSIAGLAYLWDQTSPLGWWTLKPRTQEEREMARYYQRNVLSRPDGMDTPEGNIQTENPENLPARFVREAGRRAQARSEDPGVVSHQHRLDREAKKLWLRMRREAARDLLERQLHETVESKGPPPS